MQVFLVDLVVHLLQHATVESYGIIVLGAATTQGSPFWQTWGANSYEPRHQVGGYHGGVGPGRVGDILQHQHPPANRRNFD